MARPRVHAAIAVGVAIAQVYRTGRLFPALAPFLTGVLIDVDHLIDLALFAIGGGRTIARVYLPLHGWEFLLALALAERGRLGRWTAGGMTLGYLAHLATDQLTNN